MNEPIRLRPGDVLTACDNELNVPSGFLGHSAIAVDESHIIEAVMTFPYVQKVPVSSFAEHHPKCAVYRPIADWMGAGAAAFADWYWKVSNQAYSQGRKVPPFSFSPSVPLHDPWSAIYCSKLIWLAYYYGAGYPFYNDFFLFTPEDLDTVLGRDPNFTLLYKHPDFHFVINT